MPPRPPPHCPRPRRANRAASQGRPRAKPREAGAGGGKMSGMRIAMLVVGLVLVVPGYRGAGAEATTRPATVPFPVAPAGELKDILQRELAFTHPDFVVFVPSIDDPALNQTGNEHFIVFGGPDGSLLTVWTQSTHEGEPD